MTILLREKIVTPVDATVSGESWQDCPLVSAPLDMRVKNAIVALGQVHRIIIKR